MAQDMPKPIKRINFIKKLKELGFFGPFAGGRHQFMEKGSFRISIPNPHSKDISGGLLSKIIKDLKDNGVFFK